MGLFRIKLHVALPLLVLLSACSAGLSLQQDADIPGDQLVGRVVTAKIDLPLRAGMVVYENGEIDFAIYKKKLNQSMVSVHRYERAKITKLERKSSELRLRLNYGGRSTFLNSKRGRWDRTSKNYLGTTIHIKYDHPLSAEDLRPESVARALRDVLEISGISLVPAAVPAVPPPPTQIPGTDANRGAELLSIEAHPSRVNRGQALNLNVHFEVESATNKNPISIIISRQVYKGETPLFSAPRTQQGFWTTGIHSAKFSLPVPQKTAPGIYRFKASLSYDGNTSEREVLFEVTP